ncbi:MAG: spermidine synthase [Myxococcota bacterium]|nr:spermidine synthase [Myxococcota bacterium]
MSDPPIEFLAHQDTPIGTLILRRWPHPTATDTWVTEITVDHEFLMSSHVTVSERALSRIALEMHTGPELRVLVGGLGLGYTAWEALQSPRVSHVDVVEFVPAVVDWMRAGLVPLSETLAAEPRLEITTGDVFAQLARPPEASDPHYDAILIDVDHSPEEHLDLRRNRPFYTEAGLRSARQHLAPNGVLGVWSYAESSPFAHALRRVFRDVRVTPVTFANDLLDEEKTDWLFFARD